MRICASLPNIGCWSRGRVRSLCLAATKVLVRAADLLDYRSIAPDLALHGVVYVHLLLEDHQVLFANGLPCESFHPGMAAPDMLRHHRADLRAVIPDVVDETASLWPNGPAAAYLRERLRCWRPRNRRMICVQPQPVDPGQGGSIKRRSVPVTPRRADRVQCLFFRQNRCDMCLDTAKWHHIRQAIRLGARECQRAISV